MSLEHRPRPAPFSAAVPRPSPRPLVRQPPVCAINTASNSLLLCIFMHIRANSASNNAFVFNWTQTPASVAIFTKSLLVSTSRLLSSSVGRQALRFHSLARSWIRSFACVQMSTPLFSCACALFVKNLWGSLFRKNLNTGVGSTWSPRNIGWALLFCVPSAQFSGTLPGCLLLIKEPRWS